MASNHSSSIVGSTHIAPWRQRASRVAIGVVFAVGVVGSVATSAPAADLSGVSDDLQIALDADTQEVTIGAVANVDAEQPVLSGSGQIGLSLAFDATATGSLSYSLISDSTGERTDGDVIDPQAQGELRAAIDAFNDCPAGGCAETLTIILSRTDTELEGTLGVTVSLDGVASLDAEESQGGSLTFDIDN